PLHLNLGRVRGHRVCVIRDRDRCRIIKGTGHRLEPWPARTLLGLLPALPACLELAGLPALRLGADRFETGQHTQAAEGEPEECPARGAMQCCDVAFGVWLGRHFRSSWFRGVASTPSTNGWTMHLRYGQYQMQSAHWQA